MITAYDVFTCAGLSLFPGCMVCDLGIRLVQDMTSIHIPYIKSHKSVSHQDSSMSMRLIGQELP